jgi:hypothetical protein
MKTFRRDEIENKHGQFIAYWAKQPGNTELEKYKNFNKLWEIGMNITSSITEHIIQDNNGSDITCFVSNQEGPDGYILVCFNNLGETILNTTDCCNNDQYGIIESLQDYGKL